MDPLQKAGPADEGGAAVGIENQPGRYQDSAFGPAGEVALKLAFTRFTSIDRSSKPLELRDGQVLPSTLARHRDDDRAIGERRDEVIAFYGDATTVRPFAFATTIKNMKGLLQDG